MLFCFSPFLVWSCNSSGKREQNKVGVEGGKKGGGEQEGG